MFFCRFSYRPLWQENYNHHELGCVSYWCYHSGSFTQLHNIGKFDNLAIEVVNQDHFIFLASADVCPLLITFANSLDLDQDRHNVGPDLGPNRLILIVFLKEFFEKLILKKSQ